jgi:phage protein U
LTQNIGAPLSFGLVGHWAFDETSGSTASDSSGNNNAGTLINGPVWNSAGRVGGALSFDGVNDYVSLGNPAVLIPGNAITLAGWMNLTDTSANRFIISKYKGPKPTFLRFQAGGGVQCSIGGTSATVTTSMVIGQWYHTACTYDGAIIRLYLNGVQVTTVSKTGAIADEAATDWLIGARSPSNPAIFMKGLIDDVRFYNVALTAADITQMSNPPVSDTTPPVLSNGAPSGTLPVTTTQTTLSLTTNENATCRYSTVAGTAYSAMPNVFSTTGTTSHSTSVTGLSSGNSYTFFVRCQDVASNPNTADYTISFSVASDTTPPVLSSGGPSGTLPAGTTQTTLTLATNENATCRYSTVAGTAYAAMPNVFSTTGATSHSTSVSGLSGGNTYTFFVRCADTVGNPNAADYTISFSVAASDTTPPVLSNGSPTGTLPAGTTQTTLSLATDENATCRYSTVAGTAYASMVNVFSTTGATSHSTSVSGLSGGNTYTFFVRCSDAAGNPNPADYTISFSVAPSDITPPVRSNGSPTGTLPAGTTQTTLSLATDENATCRYSTVAGTAYASMVNVFSTTGGAAHSTLVTGLSNGSSYSFFVRCLDTVGNPNTNDYSINFSVASAPPPYDITTGLMGHWAFDETFGGTAADSSGQNNTGTLINGPVWNGAGRVGGALSFDGVNDYVSLGNPASLIPGSAITMAGWMKLNDLSVNHFIISKYDGLNPQVDTYIRFQAGRGITCSVGGTALTATASISVGQWYHTACTYDGTIIRVYVNGVQVATAAKTGAIADEVGVDWLIGARTPASPGAFMNGLLDEVRVYNRALAAADITQLNNQ